MVKQLGPSYGRKLSPSQTCGVMAEPSESHDCRETQPELELQQRNRAARREKKYSGFSLLTLSPATPFRSQRTIR